jgi:anti-sigma regulatory factor (Ser/Thr protein kinase)
MAVGEALHSSTLQVRAAATDVRVASEWMARFGVQQQVPQDQIDRLDLCLNEALANVISYGNQAALTEPLYLTMRVQTQGNSGEASVTVSDAGAEFDVAHAPISERPRSLAEAEPGGLGLLMLRSFSDALDYRRIANRNALTFTVRWSFPTP